ncbi:hypothetical protein MYX64_06530 [Nitrospinae bacterium AH_259_B05_G02_I21]|nr:hypothetical protein [Nitrospinae bacterium AH_259_B05_G02_I21]
MDWGFQKDWSLIKSGLFRVASPIKSRLSRIYRLIKNEAQAILAVIATIFALWFSVLQINEFLAGRKASIELVEIEGIGVKKISEGKVEAIVPIYLVNTAGHKARDATFIQAHRPGKDERWLGFLPGWYLDSGWKEKISAWPRHDRVKAFLVSETLAGGREALCKQENIQKKKVYFAFRVGWKNPNRSRGCKVWYLEIQCARGGWAPDSKVLFASSFEGDPRNEIGELPSVGRCPGEIFFETSASGSDH